MNAIYDAASNEPCSGLAASDSSQACKYCGVINVGPSSASRNGAQPVDFPLEWQKLDAKTKLPYAIVLKDGELFAFAGLWETWRDKANGKILDSYTIITTDPNGLMEPFHDRMPAILDPKDYERWPAPAEPSHLPVDLLRPYPAEGMEGGQRCWQCAQQSNRIDRADLAAIWAAMGIPCS